MPAVRILLRQCGFHFLFDIHDRSPALKFAGDNQCRLEFVRHEVTDTPNQDEEFAGWAPAP